MKKSKNPKLELKIYWGPKAPIRAHRALQAQRAPSPPQELKGRAHSALKLLGNFCVTLHFNTISSTKEILVTTFFYSRSSFLSYPLRQLYSVPFLRSVPELLHHPGSAYIFWNNGRILMFKVSKRPYRSARHDEIIFRWHHNPPGGENLN